MCAMCENSLCEEVYSEALSWAGRLAVIGRLLALASIVITWPITRC
jgi:hypothetical protein